MNENLCIAIITTASIFAGFLVAFLSGYLTTRNKEYDENKQKFDALGRKLTLFRQLCGFVWTSNCLNEQRRNLKANEPTFDEDGNVKSFMHAIDALHRDLKFKQYKQYPYIDYSEDDLDRMKTLVNSIWYSLIHKNYQEIHFCQPLDCPMGISPGYYATLRKELSFGNSILDEGMDYREFGTIAGNVECEVLEDMEDLQRKMHKPIDCDVVAIMKSTIIVSVSGIVVPLILLWIKDYSPNIGCWNNIILFIVLVAFLYNIAMAAKHMYRYFHKKETPKGKLYNFKLMVKNSKHGQKFDDIKRQEDAFKKFYNSAKEIFSKLQESDLSSQYFKEICFLNTCPGSRAGGTNPDIVEVFWGYHPIKHIKDINVDKILTEDGVTMFFYLLPDGHVSITLYPAKTEIMRPMEDSVLLHKFVKATWLLKRKNQKSLWRDFMAYTECTSLHGTPTIGQRLRIYWLRLSHPLCVNGIEQPIKGIQRLQKIGSFVLTVGLSGFLLSIIPQCNRDVEKDYSPLITQTNMRIEDIQKVQVDLLQEIQAINANVDSLMQYNTMPKKKTAGSNAQNQK